MRAGIEAHGEAAEVKAIDTSWRGNIFAAAREVREGMIKEAVENYSGK